MSELYSREGVNNPVVNPDALTGTVTADAPLTHEDPKDETITYNAPMDNTISDDESRENKSIHYDAPVPLGDKITHEAPVSMHAETSTALLNREESEHFRMRWNEIQGKFVDEPRSAVQQADGLVSEVVEKITQMFANEQSSLAGQWNQGNEVSTEDLRKALQQYRSFFNRLVI